MNAADEDTYKFMRYFTFLTIERIEEIEQHDTEIQGRKTGQGILAEEVTRLIHGDEALQSARRITEALFSGDLAMLSEQELEQIKLDGLPASDLVLANITETPLTTLFAECGMVKTGREVKDALGRNAVLINGEAKGAADNMSTAESFTNDKALYGRFFLVKLGKKKHHLFEIKES
jgi:tyrosyl-tRNA synthetase